MTDNEIIKAFKCITYGEIDKCLRCPYDVYKECETFVYEDALELIKRQRAEIERLKVEKDNLIKTYSECQIAFLREFVEKLGKRFASNGELSWTAYHSVMDSMEELFASMTGKEKVGDSNES